MYNLRYHIASLAGVFLALALGLILGGLVVGQGTLGEQQSALVEGLRKEFVSLRAENRSLTSQNEVLGGFAAMMTDGWTAERLAGTTTLVITSAGRTDGLRATTEAVEGAGGSVVTVSIAEGGIDPESADLASAVASATGESGASVEQIVSALETELTTGGAPRPLTDALVGAGAITVDGLSDTTAASAIVNLAAPDAEPDQFALALAAAFSDAGRAAVGGQTPARDTGVAAASAARGMSALDTLGSDVGRYSLVALLSGATPGYYGLGDAAVAPYPQLPRP